MIRKAPLLGSEAVLEYGGHLLAFLLDSKLAKGKTINLIHELGARGHQNLAKLLKKVETDEELGE